MDFSNIDMDVFITELDTRRCALNLSFQNIADACGVSQSTIIRIFKRNTEPTVDILQKIMYAVSYESPKEEIVLGGYTQDDYIQFLRQSLVSREEAHTIEVGRLRADYNMTLLEERRTKRFRGILLSIETVFLVGVLTYDFLCHDRGWIQFAYDQYVNTAFTPVASLLQVIQRWLGAL